MKKKILVLTLVALMLITFSLTGCSNNKQANSSGDNGSTYTFKLGYGGATTNARHLTAEKFAKYVNEETNGRVKIDLYPSEMLGTDAEMAEMCSMGNLDMTINAVGVVGNYEPNIAILELPFLFKSYDNVDTVLDSDFGMGLLDSLPDKGLRALAYWENGLRQITNSKRPIEKPEDLNGLKLRTPENKMTLSIFNALGAKPSPLAFSELYLALSQGSYDGQENPIANIHASKFDEVQDYLTISNHKYEALVFLVSEKVWKEMPEDIQNVFSEAAMKYAKVHREAVRSEEEKQIKELEEKGMQVSRPDLTPFQEATAAVYEEYESIFGKDLIDQIVKLASE